MSKIGSVSSIAFCHIRSFLKSFMLFVFAKVKISSVGTRQLPTPLSLWR